MKFFIGDQEPSLPKYALINLGKAWVDSCFKETSLNAGRPKSLLRDILINLP
jgi:hypothetical protein